MIESIIGVITLLFGIAGAIIIVVGAIIAVFHLFQLIGKDTHKERFIALDSIRLEMGKYIVLGIEFFIGRDVIQSILVPSWNEIGMLFALIVMRTILSYFLTKEIQQGSERIKN